LEVVELFDDPFAKETYLLSFQNALDARMFSMPAQY
jgi:hypothetical protein